MSTIETQPKNRLVDSEGLSDEDNLKAMELWSKHQSINADDHGERINKFQKPEDLPGKVAVSLANEVLEEADKIKGSVRGVHKALANRVNEASAEKHYKEHEGQYQVQAVKDAAAEGVHTDFGSGSKE